MAYINVDYMLLLRHRSFGSAAINMVYVAQGSTDAYVEYGIHSWDVAAAAVIVSEAGGVILDPSGLFRFFSSARPLNSFTGKERVVFNYF